MARLRDPAEGCPWDLQQDFRSIAPYTIEEAHEVADAIARDDLVDLKDELGDLLLQVVFHARMAEEIGAFAFADVVQAICDKMIRRHPHVFADATANNEADVKDNWEKIKAKERADKGEQDQSALAGISGGLPAMTQAVKLGKKASKVGFDWPNIDGVLDKVHEEVDELKVELESGDREREESEFGDLLFAMMNYARHRKIDPDMALRAASLKFEQRFRQMEQDVDDFASKNIDELEAAWQRAKHKLSTQLGAEPASDGASEL
jgi:ATP diphosphatase